MFVNIIMEAYNKNYDSLDLTLRKKSNIEEKLLQNNNVDDTDGIAVSERSAMIIKESRDFFQNVSRLSNLKPDQPDTDNNFKIMNITGEFSVNRQLRFVSSPFHRHSFIEMIYVFDGQCHQYIETKDTEVFLEKNDICILDCNVMHAIRRPAENDIIINIMIPPEFFDSTFLNFLSSYDILDRFITQSIYDKKERHNYIAFKSSGSKKVAEIMRMILNEYMLHDACTEVMIRSYLIVLFGELLRIYKGTRNAMPKEDLDEKTLEILHYMESNLCDVTLKDVSQHFHFNTNYLSRLIRQKTNSTFMQILHELRLTEACNLLKKTAFPVSTIVEKIGYSNPNYFYRLFKSKYGYTPDQYRNL